MARNVWVKLGLPLLYEVIAESMWRSMGWVCDDRPNAVVDTLKHVFKMEKYEIVAVHASIRLTTEWAGKEDWMSQRKYDALEDKTQFVTFALDSVILSTV